MSSRILPAPIVHNLIYNEVKIEYYLHIPMKVL